MVSLDLQSMRLATHPNLACMFIQLRKGVRREVHAFKTAR
jgi:hypothetical protein